MPWVYAGQRQSNSEADRHAVGCGNPVKDPRCKKQSDCISGNHFADVRERKEFEIASAVMNSRGSRATTFDLHDSPSNERCAAKVGQRLPRRAKSRFCIDDPFDALQVAEATSEAGRFGDCRRSRAGRPQTRARSSSRNGHERTLTGRKKPGRQAIQRCRRTPRYRRDDAMEMG